MAFFKSNKVKVYPCAYRGQDGTRKLYNPEARLNLEYNLTQTKISKYYSAEAPTLKKSDSYILGIDYSNTTADYTLKCVIGGYYFEIYNCKLDTFKADNDILNLYIKVLDTEISNEITTPILSSFESGMILDNLSGDFTGLLLAKECSTATSCLSVVRLNGTTLEWNEEAFLPEIYSGHNRGDINFGKYIEGTGFEKYAEINSEGIKLNKPVNIPNTLNVRDWLIVGDGATHSTVPTVLDENLQVMGPAEINGMLTMKNAITVESDGITIKKGGLTIKSEIEPENNLMSVQDNITLINNELALTTIAANNFATKVNLDGIIKSNDLTTNSPSLPEQNFYSTEFIDTVSQASDGKISATKKKFELADNGQGSLILNGTAIDITNLGTEGKPTFEEMTVKTLYGNTEDKSLQIITNTTSTNTVVFGNNATGAIPDMTNKCSLYVNGGIKTTLQSYFAATNNFGQNFNGGGTGYEYAAVITDKGTFEAVGSIILKNNNLIGRSISADTHKLQLGSATENDTGKLEIWSGQSTSYPRFISSNDSGTQIRTTAGTLNFKSDNNETSIYAIGSTGGANDRLLIADSTKLRIPVVYTGTVYSDDSDHEIRFKYKTTDKDVLLGAFAEGGTFETTYDIYSNQAITAETALYVRKNRIQTTSTIANLELGSTYANDSGEINVYGIAAAKVFTVDNSGNVTATSYSATSDKRLKENIIDYKPEKSILDLPVYKFDFIDGKKNNIGCLAQDLQEICPEIVHEKEDGYLSIEENKLVYLLLNEVKKLKKEVEELKK